MKAIKNRINIIVLILLLTVSASFAGDPIVKSIEIRGVKRIEEGAVRARLSQKVSEPLSGRKISSDIKNIYKIGYFDDVRVESEFFEGGLKLIYIVKEKPTIVKIGFHGNKKLKEEDLKESVIISLGAIADSTLIQDNVERILKAYEEDGFYLAQVYPILRHVSESEVSLIFEIEEGKKIKIKEVNIVGNKEMATKKIKKVIQTKKWWFLSFLSGSGHVKKDLLKDDVLRVTDLYFNNGYIDVKVAEPEVTLIESKRILNITFTISEGDQYSISKIKTAGFHAFPQDVINKKITLMEGEVFSRKKLGGNIKALSEFYSERGYALISVSPSIEKDNKERKVDVVLNIDEGNIYHIGNIEIVGNTKTRDKVIRREVIIDEGGLYNSKKLKRSEQKIKNLDYFEAIEVIQKPRPKLNLVDLDIKIKEKNTGFISVGGGYSSIDRFVGLVQFTQSNLFGTGRYLKLSGELGGRASLYDITFKEPWLMDKPISLSTSIYRQERQFIDYDRKASGFSIGVGKRFWEYWSTGLTYKFEHVEVFDIVAGASAIVLEQEGKSSTSSITPKIIRDTRDSYIDPTEGSKNTFYITYAGPGGSNAFIKTGIDSLWYYPVKSVVLSLRGRVGYARGLSEKKLPIYERFYVGGIHTIRGLNFGEAGPRDKDGTLIGGENQIILNNEVIFPLLSELKVKGVLFFDIGNSFDSSDNFDDFRYTVGPGLRWLSPFGPIRIEYGFNISPRDKESAGKLEFSFGSMF